MNFAIGTGFKIAPNVGVCDVKLEQGGYLMGLIAGYLTETNVGGVDVSEIHRGHVAFLLGAQEANPDVTVLSNFTGDFNDVLTAKEAALSQIAAGADVLWQNGDGIGFGVLSACEDEDIICMGNVANQNDIAPDNTLASFVYDWGPLFVQMIEETVDGTYGDAFCWNDFSNEGVSIVWNDDLNDQYVDEDLSTMLDDAVAGFVDGWLDLGDLDAYELK